ncbi:MAG: LysR family transcriptional regulator [Pseudomonadota bacterium]|nr:LysR family transcriptional regulator [Pseudomonadota bacterium]
MDRLLAITAFRDVVDSGSFVRAAERQGVSISAVSRQVAQLEAHLNARLLNRTTRRLSLTETGRAFYERSVQILADLDEAVEVAHAGTGAAKGTLRVTAPTTFGVRHLAAVVASFMARHPDVRVDIELSDRAVDLVEEGFDVAVRIGAIGSQNLVGRQVGETRMLCCAAPDYLLRRGRPRAPRDLEGHSCLTYEYASTRHTWPFRAPEGTAIAVRVGGRLHGDNGRFLAALAVEGLGIVYEPDFIVGPDLVAGRLERLLAEWELLPSPIYVVYPSRRHLSGKVRAFADHVAASLAHPAAKPPRGAAEPFRGAAVDAMGR